MLQVRRKYPSEIRTLQVDFTKKLMLLGGEVLVVPVTVTSSDPALTLSTPVIVGTTLVQFQIGGGVAGQDYLVTVLVNTNAPSVLERTFSVEVRDDAN